MSACGASSLVVALSDNALWEEALGRIGREFSVRRRADRLEVLEQGSDLDRGDDDGHRGRGAALAAGKPGRSGLHGRSRAPLSLHVGCDGQWDRLGRDRRGDGAGGITWARSARRGWLRPSWSGRSTGSSASWADATPYAMNLIHSPGEPALEAAVVDLYLRRRVRLVEASAFLNLTLPVVRYRVSGHPARGIGPDRRAEPDHRQGVAGRGGLQVHGPAAGTVPARAGGGRRDHARAGGVGGADPDGPGHHRRGRFGRSHRQPAGDRAVADDAGPPRSDAGPARLRPCRCGSGRRAASRRPGPPRRRWRWGRRTS